MNGCPASFLIIGNDGKRSARYGKLAEYLGRIAEDVAPLQRGNIPRDHDRAAHRHPLTGEWEPGPVELYRRSVRQNYEGQRFIRIGRRAARFCQIVLRRKARLVDEAARLQDLAQDRNRAWPLRHVNDVATFEQRVLLGL